MDDKRQKLKLSEIRQRKKLTQREVADKFGVSLTTYNTWENNFGRLPIIRAKEIVSYLSDNKMTIDDIIY